MTTTQGSEARGATAWAVVAFGGLAITALGGCDPPPADEVLLGPERSVPFEVASTSVRDSVLPADEDLVVTFTRPIDGATLGPRSLVVSAPRRRRITASAVRIDGATLRLSSDLVRSVAAGETAELRIEGGASPASVRAADGSALREKFVLAFRVEDGARTDLAGPVLVASRPTDGADDISPGSLVELRFSEPVAADADSFTLREDGRERRARVRVSADRRRLLLRPERPLSPGAAVTVEIHRSLTDDAGNPLASRSPRRVAFRVRPSTLREIEEDFVSDEFADRSATGCAWGEIETPGVLVARLGTTPLPCFDAEPTTDLGNHETIRFQIRVRGDEVPGGLASALRLRFSRAGSAGPLRGARIEAGPADEDVLDPWFEGNRSHARLRVVADDAARSPWEPDETGGAVTDIAFEEPIALVPGEPLLLDVALDLEPGARLAASPDTSERALVRDGPRERLVPAAALLVSGADPSARSLWYDAGIDAPKWRTARVDMAEEIPGIRVAVSYQAAPADAQGLPDAAMASSWESDLEHVPPWRFVRFRVRFEGTAWDARVPRVDRIAMPFDATPTAR